MFSARLASFLVEHGTGTGTSDGGKTSLEIAMEMRLEGDIIDEDDDKTADYGNANGGISLPLAQEMIEEAEEDGDVCRDDVGLAGTFSSANTGAGGGGGRGLEVRWWPNLFVGYVWDGHVFSEDS